VFNEGRGDIIPGAMAKRDYYDVLGIKRDATDDQIKSAYRKLAKRFHPDRNKGEKNAESRFKEVQEAYEVLSDKAKREQYDQFGHAGVGASGPEGVQWHGGPGDRYTRVYTSGRGAGAEGIEFDLNDLEGLFGGGGGMGGIFERFRRQGRGEPRGRRGAWASDRGQDVEHEVTLDFLQAIHGTMLNLRVSGADSSAETINVRIPPGVEQGQRVRVRGKGQPGSGGGQRGDLYIVCHISPHPFFKRIGGDIYIDVPISVTEACLGAKVEMPTIDGVTVVMSVPPGTASGKKVRLKGKGVVDPKTKQRGDQYAVIRIVPPPVLDERQRSLLKDFEATAPFNPRQHVEWFAR